MCVRATEHFIVFVSFSFRFVSVFRADSRQRLTDGSPVNGVLERLHTITIAMSLH